MTAAPSYSFIIPLSGIICEFFSFSAIIEIGDIHDFSSFSNELSSGFLVSMFYCCFVFKQTSCFLHSKPSPFGGKTWQMIVITCTRGCARPFRPNTDASNYGHWTSQVTPFTCALKELIEGCFQTASIMLRKHSVRPGHVLPCRGRIAAAIFPALFRSWKSMDSKPVTKFKVLLIQFAIYTQREIDDKSLVEGGYSWSALSIWMDFIPMKGTYSVLKTFITCLTTTKWKWLLGRKGMLCSPNEWQSSFCSQHKTPVPKRTPDLCRSLQH